MSDRTRQFEAAALPHLDAAYNLARWLLRDDHSAQDVVQEAFLRALKFFDSFRGGDARPWLMGIVRNTCYTWLHNQGKAGEHVEFDETYHSDSSGSAFDATARNPETLLMQKVEREQLNEAINGLAPIFREVLILRELEDMSYEEIAQITAIPVGTVMSRLSRARAMLRTALVRAGQEKTKWTVVKTSR